MVPRGRHPSARVPKCRDTRKFALIKGGVNQLRVEMKVITHVVGEHQRLMLNQKIPAGMSETPGTIEGTLRKRRLIKSERLSPTWN